MNANMNVYRNLWSFPVGAHEHREKVISLRVAPSPVDDVLSVCLKQCGMASEKSKTTLSLFSEETHSFCTATVTELLESSEQPTFMYLL